MCCYALIYLCMTSILMEGEGFYEDSNFTGWGRKMLFPGFSLLSQWFQCPTSQLFLLKRKECVSFLIHTTEDKLICLTAFLFRLKYWLFTIKCHFLPPFHTQSVRVPVLGLWRSAEEKGRDSWNLVVSCYLGRQENESLAAAGCLLILGWEKAR